MLGHTAEEHVPQPGAPVCRADDQIHRVLLRIGADCVFNNAAPDRLDCGLELHAIEIGDADESAHSLFRGGASAFRQFGVCIRRGSSGCSGSPGCKESLPTDHMEQRERCGKSSREFHRVIESFDGRAGKIQRHDDLADRRCSHAAGPRLPRDQHWTRRVAHDSFGGGPEEEPLPSCMTVSGGNDQIGVDLTCHFADLIKRTPGSDVTINICRCEPVTRSELLQMTTKPLLDLRRRGDDWRNDSKRQRVFETMNVNQVDRAVCRAGQEFRPWNRLQRCTGEVDRYEDRVDL